MFMANCATLLSFGALHCFEPSTLTWLKILSNNLVFIFSLVYSFPSQFSKDLSNLALLRSICDMVRTHLWTAHKATKRKKDCRRLAFEIIKFSHLALDLVEVSIELGCGVLVLVKPERQKQNQCFIFCRCPGIIWYFPVFLTFFKLQSTENPRWFKVFAFFKVITPQKVFNQQFPVFF